MNFIDKDVHIKQVLYFFLDDLLMSYDETLEQRLSDSHIRIICSHFWSLLTQYVAISQRISTSSSSMMKELADSLESFRLALSSPSAAVTHSNYTRSMHALRGLQTQAQEAGAVHSLEARVAGLILLHLQRCMPHTPVRASPKPIHSPRLPTSTVTPRVTDSHTTRNAGQARSPHSQGRKKPRRLRGSPTKPKRKPRHRVVPTRIIPSCARMLVTQPVPANTVQLDDLQVTAAAVHGSNLYFATSGGCLFRQLLSDGSIPLLLVGGQGQGRADGPSSKCTLTAPSCILVYPRGQLAGPRGFTAPPPLLPSCTGGRRHPTKPPNGAVVSLLLLDLPAVREATVSGSDCSLGTVALRRSGRTDSGAHYLPAVAAPFLGQPWLAQVPGTRDKGPRVLVGGSEHIWLLGRARGASYRSEFSRQAPWKAEGLCGVAWGKDCAYASDSRGLWRIPIGDSLTSQSEKGEEPSLITGDGGSLTGPLPPREASIACDAARGLLFACGERAGSKGLWVGDLVAGTSCWVHPKGNDLVWRGLSLCDDTIVLWTSGCVLTIPVDSLLQSSEQEKEHPGIGNEPITLKEDNAPHATLMIALEPSSPSIPSPSPISEVSQISEEIVPVVSANLQPAHKQESPPHHSISPAFSDITLHVKDKVPQQTLPTVLETTPSQPHTLQAAPLQEQPFTRPPPAPTPPSPRAQRKLDGRHQASFDRLCLTTLQCAREFGKARQYELSGHAVSGAILQLARAIQFILGAVSGEKREPFDEKGASQMLSDPALGTSLRAASVDGPSIISRRDLSALGTMVARVRSESRFGDLPGPAHILDDWLASFRAAADFYQKSTQRRARGFSSHHM
eukprot:gnl/Dysnectes_brevis/5330_a7615_299.p1 GENE.gnl/Dysnectes_brevis/5330_a7615_299~~gnl/Dysnectes_brevis/5330_a7615_299.p1  ORF type:complete len:846 (-),score=240.52 gnl/Dysnectes_brevis/5330_a7615_299:69-2606(-)